MQRTLYIIGCAVEVIVPIANGVGTEFHKLLVRKQLAGNGIDCFKGVIKPIYRGTQCLQVVFVDPPLYLFGRNTVKPHSQNQKQSGNQIVRNKELFSKKRTIFNKGCKINDTLHALDFIKKTRKNQSKLDVFIKMIEKTKKLSVEILSTREYPKDRSNSRYTVVNAANGMSINI